MKGIKLVIEDDLARESFFNILKEKAKIPVCTSCGMLYPWGFPNNDDGICDFIICEENKLICECINFKTVQNLYNQKQDGSLDISKYFKVVSSSN